jgi:cytochrome P450
VVDTHCHLDSCKPPDAELVERAAAAGVRRIATVGMDTPTIERALEAALRQWTLRLNTSFLLPTWLPIPTNVRARRAVRRMDEFIVRLIRDRRGTPRESPRDLLDLLLTERSEGGDHLSDTALRDECMTIFLAGHETTAIALSWTWYLLAQHPAAEAQLYAELRRVLAGRAPTADDLPELRFTRKVVRESLRLYPPAWAIGREAAEHCELGDFSIRRGTQVYMSQWVVHRDPRLFAHPDRFRPERWTDDFERALPRFAYFPFGGGPRVCIGNTFALLEGLPVLAAIARRFRVELVPGQTVVPDPTFTLRPRNGVKVLLRPP